MSCKTAVCVLFVFSLITLGSAADAQAGPGLLDAAPGSSAGRGPQTVSAAQGPAIDPDGLATPGPGLLSELMGFLVDRFLGAFVL